MNIDKYYICHYSKLSERKQYVENHIKKFNIELEWILSYDKETDSLVNGWVDEQHLGQLSKTIPVFAIDMWEHSYVGDYWSSGKKQYVEDFFKNVNWSVAETNFDEAVK